MPTVQDEEESLCLLASDLQESTADPTCKDDNQSHMVGDKHWQACSNNESSEYDEESTPSFLSQGTAEKAFFNVCKTNDEEEDDCVEVMNDIIGALEADHEASVNAAAAAAAAASKTASEIDAEPRNSRSLVVDIHLPPTTEAEDEGDANNVQQQQEQQPQVAVAAASRPCKHEVNRFQRCYSDGSQASPKKKAKAST